MMLHTVCSDVNTCTSASCIRSTQTVYFITICRNSIPCTTDLLDRSELVTAARQLICRIFTEERTHNRINYFSLYIVGGLLNLRKESEVNSENCWCALSTVYGAAFSQWPVQRTV
jgi:hypothetical protein